MALTTYNFFVSSEEFLDKCIVKAECVDVIHDHSNIDILINLYKKFRRSKKFILHYHGTEIRGTDQPGERESDRRVESRTSQMNIVCRLFLKAKRRLEGYLGNESDTIQK